jgi:hypothetical protein
MDDHGRRYLIQAVRRSSLFAVFATSSLPGPPGGPVSRNTSPRQAPQLNAESRKSSNTFAV